MGLIKKLRKAKKEAPPNEKPAVVKTHLRDMIIVPEMIGSVVGVYNGKTFNAVEIKPEMTGHYLAELLVLVESRTTYPALLMHHMQFHLIQTSEAWSPRYRSNTLIPIVRL